MNGTQPVKCAIWARVSSTDGSQTTENQLFVLREWAARRGFEVAREFITEDSAWANGNGAKGKEFDRQRTALKAGAKRGEYSRILIWSLDRLSRRGIKDTIGILDDLADAGAIVCSHQETWTETTDRRMQELIISVMSWMAEMESSRRSERIRAGMARAKREGKQVGGRTAGAKDRKPRTAPGLAAAWQEGGKLREASRRRPERTFTCQNPDCGKEFTSRATVEPRYCSDNCAHVYDRLVTAVEGSRDALEAYRELGADMPDGWERLARARTARPDAGWGAVAAQLGLTREQALKEYQLMRTEVAAMRRRAARHSAEVADAVEVLRRAGVSGADELLAGQAQIAAKRAAQENGSGEDQDNAPATG